MPSPPSSGAFPPTMAEVETEEPGTATRVRPFLFLVVEGSRPLSGGARFTLDLLDEVVVGRTERTKERRRSSRTLVADRRRRSIQIPDGFLSREHAIIRRSTSGWEIADLGSRNGVSVNDTPVVGPRSLEPGDRLLLGRTFFIFDLLESEQLEDFDAEDDSTTPEGFVTVLPALARSLRRLKEEASRNTSITLVGETGTGKEVLAKAIHEASKRRGPYLAVNCGALPRDLIQSELFGTVKGGYTGAENRSGYLRDAHQGTLLLDEVVAAPEQVQISLLRAIQERAVTPVGGTRPQPVDVRFICAAQKPLVDVVKAGQFREDLRQRIEAFRFDLPPLRARQGDIGNFIASKLRSMGLTEKDRVTLLPKAVWKILRYDWPGNIRELTQQIDVSWGGAKNGEIDGSDLPEPAKDEEASGSRLKKELVGHLRATRGNVTEAAQRMGRSRWYMYEQIRKLGLDPDSFRSG